MIWQERKPTVDFGARARRRHCSSVGTCAALATSAILAAAARASDDGPPPPLAEIVVTALKRTELMQNVPASVEALGTEKLRELQVSSFDDYARYLPSLGAVNFGSGQEQLYVRGITNKTDGSSVGSQPTVAVYLDEQPVTTISHNLDVHIYDIARVEQLSGPQGTLFGSSAMGGTLRIITNKPSITGFEAGFDLDANSIQAGSPGGTLEGYVNVPLSQFSAIRLVGFVEHDGGFINNVLGPPETYPTSGIPRTNAGLTKEHYNDTTTSGGRAALKVDLNESWTILPSLVAQTQTANGIPAYEPALGDLNVATYSPEKNVDRWLQAALTVQGRLSRLDVQYTGAYLKRTVYNEFDYSQYSFDYDTYYYPYFGQYFIDASGHLISPAEYAVSNDAYTKLSHELRLTSPQSWRLRFVAGLFLQRQVDDTRNEYRISGLAAAQSVVDFPGLYYLNAMSRVDRDQAAFGEVTYDLTPKLSVTAGLREFRYDNTVYGFFGYQSSAPCLPGSEGIAGPGRPCINVDQAATRSGSTYKLNLSYRLDADRMVYATWSTGFRPGGINRVLGVGPYAPDSLVNFEAGWKTEWLGHRVRFNGALFLERWKDPQFSVCGPGCVTEVINAGGAQTRGLETQLEWRATRALTLSSSATWLEAKLTANACQYGSSGSLCNDAAGVPDPTVLPVARSGFPLPTSKFKANFIARYAFHVHNFGAHVQAAVAGQSSMPTGLPSVNGGLQAGNAPGYSRIDLSTGLTRESWAAELYLKNVFDDRGEENRAMFCGLPTCNQLYVMPIPPRTLGVAIHSRF